MLEWYISVNSDQPKLTVMNELTQFGLTVRWDEVLRTRLSVKAAHVNIYLCYGLKYNDLSKDWFEKINSLALYLAKD